jgi:hypothetical protein
MLNFRARTMLVNCQLRRADEGTEVRTRKDVAWVKTMSSRYLTFELQRKDKKLAFETRSQPMLTRSYPRRFTLITRTASCSCQLP